MKKVIYIILGIIQGITEVLPISSSAHLIIFEHIFNITSNNLGFEVLLHMASLVGILVYLRKEILNIITGFIKYLFKKEKEYKEYFMIVIYMIISTIPIVMTTIIIKLLSINLHSLTMTGLMLIINAFILLCTKKFYKNKDKLKLKNTFIIGLTQSMGVLPGISRSGSCLFGGYISKLNKDESKRYAFLLFLPSVIGAFVLELNNIKDIFLMDKSLVIITLLITSVVTFIAFKLIDYIINKDKLYIFGYYTLILGMIVLIYSFKMGVI